MRFLLVLMGLLLLQSCSKEETVTEETAQVTVTETTKPEETPEVVTEPMESEEVASNNGGTVVEYKGITYLAKKDEEQPADAYVDAIYTINEGVTEKFIELNNQYVNSMYIDDGYLYYNDLNEGDENIDNYIVKVSLDTKEKEFLQVGEIEYLDTEKNEIYYSEFYFDDDDSYHSNVYKMDTQGENIVELAMGDYEFIEKVDNLVYLEKSGEVDDVIISSVNTDGSDLKNVLETKEGAYLTDPEAYEDFKEFYIYEVQKICDFEVYNDTIYFILGGYEGSGSYFFGALCKVGTDGEGFEMVYDGIENFYIIDNNMYVYAPDVKDGKSEYIKMNLDTKEITYLDGKFDWILTADETSLYSQYTVENENGVFIDDLKSYNVDNEEVIMLYEGINAPIKTDSNYVAFYDVQSVGDYIYFRLHINGFDENTDGWRGHQCYSADYRVKKDGSGLELIYEDPNSYCPE